MRRLTVLVLMLSTVFAVAAHASGGNRPDPPPAATGGAPAPQGSSAALTTRQQAEQWYADAYDDIAKAKQDAADGKAKNSEKRFRRALDRAMRATEYDTTYHEAWNLAGFAARKLGNYPKSLAAYRTSIRLNGGYAPAREYYGHALLESGDLKGAEEQLAWLQNSKATELAASLQAAIDAKKGAKAAAEPAQH